MQGDQLRQFICKIRTVLGHTATKLIFRKHRVTKVVHLQRRPKRLSIRADAADRRPAVIHTVIALLPSNEASLGGLPLEAPIGPRHFERGIGGFRARVGIEHIVEPLWHECF